VLRLSAYTNFSFTTFIFTKQGRPLCQLTLAAGALHVDVDGDGVVDHIHALTSAEHAFLRTGGGGGGGGRLTDKANGESEEGTEALRSEFSTGRHRSAANAFGFAADTSDDNSGGGGGGGGGKRVGMSPCVAMVTTSVPATAQLFNATICSHGDASFARRVGNKRRRRKNRRTATPTVSRRNFDGTSDDTIHLALCVLGIFFCLFSPLCALYSKDAERTAERRRQR
jgi:hypothetical protein